MADMAESEQPKQEADERVKDATVNTSVADAKTSSDSENKNKVTESSTDNGKATSKDDKSTAAGESCYGFDGVNHTYTDPRDNTVYIWDRERNGWFPKVDEDFMAQYQMNYGFTDSNEVKNETQSEEKTTSEVENSGKRKPTSQEPGWFDVGDKQNTKVYVSNLPEDITEVEFVEFMQKCGLVMKDVSTGKWKVKLYAQADGILKGDALCTYIKKESVDLALQLLDGSDLRGKKVSVEKAKFEMKGAYDPKLKPKKKRKREKEKEKKIQEKLFDWRPDKLRGERENNERSVIIKNLFEPKIFDNKMELILEYTEDLREECSKCGTIRKLQLFDKHPEGVAQVTFADAEEADLCIKLLNNRWFGQRRITAQTWDGKTKYRVTETDAEVKDRMEGWNKFLETGAEGQSKS